ncbi:hypothetical protein FRC00_012156, partial [Tulasnella sp. 408]
MPRESYLLRDLNSKDPSLLWYPDDVQAWVKAPIVPSRILKSDGATSSDEPPATMLKRRGTLTGRTRELAAISIPHRRTQSLRHGRNNWFDLSEGALGLTNMPQTAPILRPTADGGSTQKTTSHSLDLNIKSETPIRQDIHQSKDQILPAKSRSLGQARSPSIFITKQRTKASPPTTTRSLRSSLSQPEVLAVSASSIRIGKGSESHRASILEENDLIRESEEDRQPPFQAQGAEPGTPYVVIDDIGSSVTYVSPIPVKVNGRFCDVFEGMHVTAGKVALKRPRIGATGYDE